MPGRFYPRAGPWSGRHVRYTGFDFDRDGIARCAVGPELRDAVSSIAREAMGYAQLIAPPDSRRYLAGFSTDVEIVPDIPFRVRGEPMARWAGRVVNDSSSAILVEVGDNQSGDGRVLRRTLEWIELVAGD